MKKNFFKKLSFVLALAMIISAIAPAASAFAAEALHLNTSGTKYLHLSGKPGPSEFNFNIHGDKQKGWQYDWSSSNENVASVESNGVTTAVGVGTADITVAITDKSGADVDTLTAKVVVKDNIETVTVANAPTAALSVDQEYDFNRSFVTLSGSTTKTTSVTRWAVDKTDTASIVATSGLFKATAAGEYKVTALAFQSAAKYEEWLVSKDASLVNDSDEVTVTVAAGIKSVKQVDADTFTVTFDSDMSKTDIKTAAILNKIVANKPVSTGTEKIKAITLDATGKIATVDMYVALSANTDYQFVYGTLTGAFKTAVKSMANIAAITFNDFDVTIPAAKDMLGSVVATDANGVVIYTGSEISSNLTFEYKGDYTKGNTASTNAYIYTEGYSAEILVKFSAVVYDDATKTYKTLAFSDSAIATGKKTDTNIAASSLQFAAPLTADATANDKLTYSATSVTVAAKDSNKIVVKYLTNDSTTAKYDSATESVFTYTSTNADKLLIVGDYMYPISAGTVTVLVYNGTTAIGAFDVNILAARAFGSAVPASNAVINVGNSTADTTGVTVKVAVKDTLEQAIAQASITGVVVTNMASPVGAITPPAVTASATGNGEVSVVVKGTNPGSSSTGIYSYRVRITALGADKDVFFTINVVDATSTSASVAAYYQLELGNTSVDIKGVTSSAVTVKVFGYNAAGVKVVELNSAKFAIEVKDAGGANAKNAFDSTSITVVTVATGNVVADATGSYVVTVKTTDGTTTINGVSVATGASLAAGTLTVTDTTTKEYSVDSYAVSAANVLAAVKAAFNFKINGTDCEDANGFVLASLDYTTGAAVVANYSAAAATATAVAAGNSIYVSSVTFTQAVAGATIAYTIDINRSITIR